MKKIINIKIDGHSKSKYYDKPFKGSHLLSYKYDNKTYTYSYDDVEEMAKELENQYNYDDDYMIFKIENQKIIDVETVPGEFSERLKDYENYYILFNGLILVAEFLKMTEN